VIVAPWSPGAVLLEFVAEGPSNMHVEGEQGVLLHSTVRLWRGKRL
jgi:hypothetical protein